MSVNPVPEGYRTVTPYLLVEDVSGLLEFCQAAFGATIKERHDGPDGGVMHAEVVIGDSIIMMGGARDEWKPLQAMLYLYLPDCDGVYKKALAAGATSLREPRDEFYGDRTAGVKGPAGNQWWLATHVEDVSPEEMARRAAEAAGAGGA